MFTPLGNFKYCVCVYYASGLCNRPNCFYNHRAKLERVEVDDNSGSSSLYKHNKTILNKGYVVKTMLGNIKTAEVPHESRQIKKEKEYDPVLQPSSSTSRSPNKYTRRETQQIPAAIEKNKRPYNRVDNVDVTDSVDGIENKKLAVDVAKHLENSERPYNRVDDVDVTDSVDGIENKKLAVDVAKHLENSERPYNRVDDDVLIESADGIENKNCLAVDVVHLENPGSQCNNTVSSSATTTTTLIRDVINEVHKDAEKQETKTNPAMDVTQIIEACDADFSSPVISNTKNIAAAVHKDDATTIVIKTKQLLCQPKDKGDINQREMEKKPASTTSKTSKNEDQSKIKTSKVKDNELLHLNSQPNLYSTLVSLTLSADDMMRFGYPISPTVGLAGQCGRAICYKIVDGHSAQIGNNALDSDIRKCDRCKTTYRVTEAGYPVRNEKCLYHYGHRLESVEKGESGSWYTCCNGDSGSEGCTDAPAHVSDDPGNIVFSKGFVRLENIESSWSVIAMDCSMVYTTVGKELAKITIVNHKKEILFEKLVMPRNPILDYNTRFSGITEELIVQGPTITVEDVQTFLLINLSPNSIIIGHNLESALLAVKLIHTKVVDTAILYSDVKGSKNKQSLESLSQEFCKRIIRSFSSTYYSYDNAISALELALLKANEILNKRESNIKNKQNSK